MSEIEFEFANTNFICLCFTESWLTNNISNDMLHIEGFKIIRQDRAQKKRGGGLIIYLRKDLEWDFLNENLNKSDGNIEILSIVIKGHCQKPLFLSLCYIPPASNIDHAIEIIDLLGNEINKIC